MNPNRKCTISRPSFILSKKNLTPFYSSREFGSNDIPKITGQKWMPGASTMKIKSAEKKALCFIASYIVSSLTYVIIFIKSMKRKFFFTYQNSVNTGHT